MTDMDDLYPDEYGDDFPCPRCDGWGHVDCYCGGDLCVCDNYGEMTCPACGGEGSVSEAQHEKYLAAQREWLAAYQVAINNRRKVRSTKLATTPKRAKVKAARKQRQRNA